MGPPENEGPGVDTFTMLDYYYKEVRVHLELAVPVWHSGLTLKLTSDIERVQRVVICILLSNDQFSYEQACSWLGMKPLFIRRQELCENFAVKTSSSKCRHSHLFELEKDGNHFTRSSNSRYREHICHISRFFKSPLPYLTRTLNEK